MKQWFRILLSFVVLICIGIADYYIPPEANTTLFYYIPIFVFAYRENQPVKITISFAILTSFVWGFVDYRSHTYAGENYILYNTFSRAVSFALVGMVFNLFYVEKYLHRKVVQQKDLLNEANHKLKTTNDELNRFIGMAAHDIRNPIGSIQMMSEMVMEDRGMSDESREFVEMIRNTAANSLLILNDTLNISQIQSGTINLLENNADYIAFIRECIRQNEHLAKKKNQKIQFEPLVTFAYITFDKNRMMQVINNLLTNAIKYSDFNTTILIDVAYTANDHKFIRTEIIDNGPGIDESFHATLFDPFKTTNNEPTAKEAKTGLGLAIVKKIVELHHGTVGFTSTVGKGSTFFFVIPVSIRKQKSLLGPSEG